MEKVAVFVQVRYSSKRLPGKVLMKINGMTLIERLYARLSHFLDLPVVFLTSTDPSDDIIKNHLVTKNIPYFRGDLNNVLNRFIYAGKTLGYSAFFRITGDNPFVDAVTMANHWKEFIAFDYVDNIHGQGSTIGTGFEFVKLAALQAIPQPVNKYDQEHVTTYIRNHSENFKSWRFIPEENKRSEKVFLTCDYPEDFELINEVFSFFDYSNIIEVENILNLLNQHQDLVQINSGLHTRPNY